MKNADKDVETITDLERQRVDALVAGDLDAVAAISHPELTYVHSTGVIDTLESYLRKCREGLFVYRKIDQMIGKVRVRGDVGLVFAETEADVTSGGSPKHLRITSLAVWVRDDGSWRLLAYQTTAKR
jgi:uncharacterized protein (TIGR02246 family)